jgi:hypothetical protein
LIYTSLGDKSELKQAAILRKLLDLIKKKYKDDLMENLLQEEYSSTIGGAGATNSGGIGDIESGGATGMGTGKTAKKKKKKAKEPNQEATEQAENT